MVEELIKHHWCDQCGYERRVEGRGVTIEIDGTRWEVDLCPQDEATEIHPVLRFLEKFGRPVGGKPAAAPVANVTRKPRADTLPGLDASRAEYNYPCPLCSKSKTSGGNFATHLRKEHARTTEEIFGTDCLECEFAANTYFGLSSHVNKIHGVTVPRMFMQHILRNDPTGLVRKRGLMPT